jgi:hypothetical protein
MMVYLCKRFPEEDLNRLGSGKRKYSLALIKARLPKSAETSILMGICGNLCRESPETTPPLFGYD